MRQRLIYLMKVYMLTVVVFIAAKLVFMLVNYEGHAFGIGDVCAVIVHGLTLDLSTSLYFLILPFLTTLVSLWWDDRRLHTFLRIYYGNTCLPLVGRPPVTYLPAYLLWHHRHDADARLRG